MMGGSSGSSLRPLADVALVGIMAGMIVGLGALHVIDGEAAKLLGATLCGAVARHLAGGTTTTSG